MQIMALGDHEKEAKKTKFFARKVLEGRPSIVILDRQRRPTSKSAYRGKARRSILIEIVDSK